MDLDTVWRPHLRGAPGGGPWQWLVRALGFGVVLTLVGLLVPELGIASSADPAPVGVAITGDRSSVVVELDDRGHSAAPVPVHYRIQVDNTGHQPVHGVVVRVELGGGLVPAPGQRLAVDVGDLAAHASWRTTLSTTVDPATLSGSQLSPVVVVDTAAGVEVTSAPAVTRVAVLAPAVTLSR